MRAWFKMKRNSFDLSMKILQSRQLCFNENKTPVSDLSRREFVVVEFEGWEYLQGYFSVVVGSVLLKVVRLFNFQSEFRIADIALDN